MAKTCVTKITYKHEVKQLFVAVFLKKFMSRREVQMISDLPKKFQISVGMTLTVRRKFGDDRPVERIRDRFQDLETRKRLETELGGESGWIGRISFRIPSVLVKNVNAVLVCEGFVFIL